MNDLSTVYETLPVGQQLQTWRPYETTRLYPLFIVRRMNNKAVSSCDNLNKTALVIISINVYVWMIVCRTLSVCTRMRTNYMLFSQAWMTSLRNALIAVVELEPEYDPCCIVSWGRNANWTTLKLLLFLSAWVFYGNNFCHWHQQMAAARIVFAARTAPVSGQGPQFESRTELPKVKP